MAKQFQEVFGGRYIGTPNTHKTVHSLFTDLLLTKAVSPSSNKLPSPNQLKRKIIIKVRWCVVHVWGEHGHI